MPMSAITQPRINDAVNVVPAFDPVVSVRVVESPVIAGESARDIFEFSVVNRGPSDAAELILQTSLILPEHVTLQSGAATRGAFDPATGRWKLDLPEGGLALLTLKLHATREASAGTDTVGAAMEVLTTNPPLTGDTADNTARATVSVISPRAVAAATVAGPALVRQTGLYVQRVTITNNNLLPLPAMRIHVGVLTDGWSLQNAAGSDDQGSYVEVPGPLAPGAAIGLSFEFYSATRTGVPSPQYTVTILRMSPAEPAPASKAFEITRVLPLAGGDLLLEWPSVPGERYEVQYSSDLIRWRAAVPPVTAAGTRTQWIDNGLPKTLWSLFQDGSRYYRVARTISGDQIH